MEPRHERLGQVVVPLRPQKVAQRLQRLAQTRRVARLLQTDERRHQVVRPQVRVRHTRPVQKIVSLRRLVRRQQVAPHQHEVRHLDRRRPRPAAVVEDHGQHRRHGGHPWRIPPVHHLVDGRAVIVARFDRVDLEPTLFADP